MTHGRIARCVAEPHPLLRRLVDVRRLRELVAVDAPVLPRHIVRDHQKNIRSPACVLCVRRIRRECGEFPKLHPFECEAEANDAFGLADGGVADCLFVVTDFDDGVFAFEGDNDVGPFTGSLMRVRRVLVTKRKT